MFNPAEAAPSVRPEPGEDDLFARLDSPYGRRVVRAFDRVTDDRAGWIAVLARGRRAWEDAHWVYEAMRGRGEIRAATLRKVAALLADDPWLAAGDRDLARLVELEVARSSRSSTLDQLIAVRTRADRPIFRGRGWRPRFAVPAATARELVAFWLEATGHQVVTVYEEGRAMAIYTLDADGRSHTVPGNQRLRLADVARAILVAFPELGDHGLMPLQPSQPDPRAATWSERPGQALRELLAAYAEPRELDGPGAVEAIDVAEETVGVSDAQVEWLMEHAREAYEEWRGVHEVTCATVFT